MTKEKSRKFLKNIIQKIQDFFRILLCKMHKRKCLTKIWQYVMIEDCASFAVENM